MTAIGDLEPSDGEESFSLDDGPDHARGLSAVPGTPDAAMSGEVDPALELGRRLLALESGNASQRHLAALLGRGLGLAEAIGRPRDPNTDDHADPDATYEAPSGYRIAIEGVDAFESLISAAEAGKARAVTDAYAHARDELLDPDLSPGQHLTHPDSEQADRVLSCTQIVGGDLSVVLNQSPGFAKQSVAEATTLVRHMPHTLARLERGELTAYQRRQIITEAAHYPPELAEQLDELVCGRPFTGRYVGTGDHRATRGALTRRLNKAVAQVGYQPPDTVARKRGHAGRHVRFGPTGPDGMTPLYGSLPAVVALAINTLLDDLARTAPESDPRTHDQRRADAFAALFTGPAALSPAAQTALELPAPSFDEDGQYVVVGREQNLEAASIWDTIRLLAASVGLTFPDVPRATVNVDVTLETLTNQPCTTPDGRPNDDGGAGPPAASRPTSARTACDSCNARGHGRPGCGESSTHAATSRHRAASVRGIGPIPDHLAQRLARFADLRRIVTDPLGGQPLEVGRRRPSRALRDAVLNRDRHCRFPGCTRVTNLDLDHITPYRDDAPPEGQTRTDNLQALCREHHRAKHQLHWRPIAQRDGSITWRNNLLDITATT